MKKKIIFLCLSIIALLLISAGLFYVSKSRTFQFFGGLTNSVKTNEKVIALTFDDAPTNHSDEVVAILASKNVTATFYVIGQNAEDFPSELKNIVIHGHELGNHSFTHPRFILKPLSFIESEIQKTNALIRNAGYEGSITFRPPNGKKLFLLPWYLHQQNMKTIMWDVEPDSFVARNSDAIAKYTLTYAKPGSIILLHPFCEKECKADRQALPRIIDGLRTQGYRFVTISELLKFDRIPQ